MKIIAQFLCILELKENSDIREDFVINHETRIELKNVERSEPSNFLGIVGKTHVLDNKLRIIGLRKTSPVLSARWRMAHDLLRSIPQSCVGVMVFADYFCFLYLDGRLQMNTGQTFTADSE